jgi:hypothetical protein
LATDRILNQRPAIAAARKKSESPERPEKPVKPEKPDKCPVINTDRLLDV